MIPDAPAPAIDAKTGARQDDDGTVSERITNLHPAKAFCFGYLERNAEAIACLNDSIFHYAELGMQEFESAKLMTALLEEGGFSLARGICGFPTGFCATFGAGAPVIAIHTEYDANPDNSQCSGIAEQKPIVEGAPGHCEGHNVNGAVLVAAALAAKAAVMKFGLSGTLKVFGAPAEEQLVSRPYYVRDGLFDDVDAAIGNHIGPNFAVGYGLIQAALISASFTFHGETAHAGVAPWRGRDALDGVVLMDVGLAQYREHMTPSMRMHRVITEGGDQPNVAPRRAAVWWYFRDSSAEGAGRLFEQAKRIAQGAAMMSNTTVEIDVMGAVWPVRGNRTLAELVEREIEHVGLPRWTKDEDDLARTLQAKVNVPVEGLARRYVPMQGPAVQKSAANDAGDISWKVPMVKLYFPASVPNISFHHWAAGVPLATSIAHKGAVAGAKAMAASIVECLANPSIVEEAKRIFKTEIGGTEYKSLLPPGQKPPVHLNRAIMDKFRPLLEPHYLTQKPEFVP
jgi:aminobenzoyl-glutamate utilization protein B